MANLIGNPGAEVDTTGWSLLGGSLARVTTPVRTGVGALRHTSDAAGSQGIIWYEILGLAPGQVYNTAIYVRSASVARSVSLKVDWFKAGVGFRGTSNVATVTSSTAAWTLVSGTATVPADADVGALYVRADGIAGAGEIHYYDDALFESPGVAPVANAGANQSVEAGATVVLNGSGSDADGTVASYAWSLSSVPTGSTAALSGTGASRTFVADLVGAYVASLVVTDNLGLTSAPDTLTVTASAPSPGPTRLVRNAANTAWQVRKSKTRNATGTAWLWSTSAVTANLLRGVNVMHPLEHHGNMQTFTIGAQKLADEWGGNVVAHGYATRAVQNNTAHPYSGTPYLTLMDQFVQLCEDHGHTALLRPRWSGIEGRVTDGGSPTQQQFVGIPPQEAIDSLATLAARYLGRDVIFATQVEPNGSLTWAQYRTYANACVAAVRATGSQAKVGVPGLDWGRNISGAVASPVVGSNVFYITHVYNRQSTWQANFGVAVDAGLEVFVGEFGQPFNEGEPAVMTQAEVDALLLYMSQHSLGGAAWAFEADQSPTLITSDTTCAPTVPYGASVQTWLGGSTPASAQLNRGAAVTATSGTATTLVDGDWSNGEWRSSGYPATVTMTGLASAGQVTVAHSSGNYIGDSNVTGGDTYNEMGAYVYESSSDGTTWTARATVTGNTRRARSHTFDLGGHSRLRLRATGGNPKNASGNTDAALRYLEVSTNLLDTWLLHGDSILTAGAQAERNIGGRVTAVNSARQPLVEALGWPSLGITHVADAGTQRTAWLGYLTGTAMRQCVFAMGANDYAMAAATFETKLRVAVADLLNAGITPHLATIPWSPDATRNTGVQALNARIAAVVSGSSGKVKAGPDLYAYFAANPTLISGDQLHPTEPAGYNAWAQQVAAYIAAATPTTTAPGTTL